VGPATACSWSTIPPFFRNMLAPLAERGGICRHQRGTPRPRALIHAAAPGARVDVVITDIDMPGHGRFRADLGGAPRSTHRDDNRFIGLSSLVKRGLGRARAPGSGVCTINRGKVRSPRVSSAALKEADRRHELRGMRAVD